MLGPKGPTVGAEGCSPLQELEKAARRAAIFLVVIENRCIDVGNTDCQTERELNVMLIQVSEEQKLVQERETNWGK